MLAGSTKEISPKTPKEEDVDFNHATGGVLSQAHIGSINELDEEARHNPALKTGYRINYTTWPQILMSLFEWHNETINIWSHGLGFIAFFVILLVVAFTDIGEEVETSRGMSGFYSFMREPNSWDFGLIESQKNEMTLVMSTIE